MNIIRKLKKEDTQVEIPPLTLAGLNGDAWMKFPDEVVQSVRQGIIRMKRSEPFPQRLALTSAIRQEGVSYLSKAIGTVLAMDERETVCVLELNWWNPTDYPPEIANRPGIADVLLESITLEEALVPTGLDNLAFIPAGKLARIQRPTFARSHELQDYLNDLSQQFDHLILDLPSVSVTSETIILASMGDAVCLVINQGVTPVPRVRMALDDLNHLNIIGVLMNQFNISTPSFILNYIAQD